MRHDLINGIEEILGRTRLRSRTFTGVRVAVNAVCHC